MAAVSPKNDAAPVVVLSPHLDDAAFSAWHALVSSSKVQVISIFAGIPEEGFVTTLDRSHGAEESAAWMYRRRQEDHDVLALVGAAPVHLDLLDVQYRAHRVPWLADMLHQAPERLIQFAREEPRVRVPPDEIGAVVDGLFEPDAVVYAPLGVGGHPDHEDVGRFAAAIVGTVREVRLFADSPYYLRHGPPSWITGVPNPAADAAIERAWSSLAAEAPAPHSSVVVLEPDEVGRKLDAIRRYGTEFESIEQDFAGAAGNPELMRYEVYWGLP